MGAVAEMVRYELFQHSETGNLRSLLLWVDEKYFDSTTSLSLGTTLTDFMATAPQDVPKGDAVEKFGSWVYTGQAQRQNGCLRFWFAKAFSSGEKTTAFLELSKVRSGIYWPPVFISMVSPFTAVQAYDANGVAYTTDINWDFNIRDGYDGPTAVVERFYASHEPFSIFAPTVLLPHGGTFYYGLGSVQLPRCLHPLITLEYSTGTANSRFPYQVFSKTFAATTLTEWPSTLVIDDDQVFDNGLYIRKTVTALRPSIL